MAQPVLHPHLASRMLGDLRSAVKEVQGQWRGCGHQGQLRAAGNAAGCVCRGGTARVQPRCCRRCKRQMRHTKFALGFSSSDLTEVDDAPRVEVGQPSRHIQRNLQGRWSNRLSLHKLPGGRLPERCRRPRDACHACPINQDLGAARSAWQPAHLLAALVPGHPPRHQVAREVAAIAVPEKWGQRGSKTSWPSFPAAVQRTAGCLGLAAAGRSAILTKLPAPIQCMLGMSRPLPAASSEPTL